MFSLVIGENPSGSEFPDLIDSLHHREFFQVQKLHQNEQDVTNQREQRNFSE